MHIAASPRIQRSHSRKLAEYFIGKFLKENPDYTLDQYDIAKGELAQFTEPGATAKFKSLRNVPMTLDETAQWIAAQDEFKRFAAADKYNINSGFEQKPLFFCLSLLTLLRGLFYYILKFIILLFYY